MGLIEAADVGAAARVALLDYDRDLARTGKDLPQLVCALGSWL